MLVVLSSFFSLMSLLLLQLILTLLWPDRCDVVQQSSCNSVVAAFFFFFYAVWFLWLLLRGVSLGTILAANLRYSASYFTGYLLLLSGELIVPCFARGSSGSFAADKFQEFFHLHYDIPDLTQILSSLVVTWSRTEKLFLFAVLLSALPLKGLKGISA